MMGNQYDPMSGSSEKLKMSVNFEDRGTSLDIIALEGGHSESIAESKLDFLRRNVILEPFGKHFKIQEKKTNKPKLAVKVNSSLLVKGMHFLIGPHSSLQVLDHCPAFLSLRVFDYSTQQTSELVVSSKINIGRESGDIQLFDSYVLKDHCTIQFQKKMWIFWNNFPQSPIHFLLHSCESLANARDSRVVLVKHGDVFRFDGLYYRVDARYNN